MVKFRKSTVGYNKMLIIDYILNSKWMGILIPGVDLNANTTQGSQESKYSCYFMTTHPLLKTVTLSSVLAKAVNIWTSVKCWSLQLQAVNQA